MSDSEYTPKDPFGSFDNDIGTLLFTSIVMLLLHFFKDSINEKFPDFSVDTVVWSVEIGIIILIISTKIIAEYNYLSYLNNNIENDWHNANEQLRRRTELIPKFIELVEGFLAHEKSTFTEVARARNQYLQSNSRLEQADASIILNSALANLYAVVESNPVLTSQPSITALHNELVGTENNISEYRIAYNKCVKIFNIVIDRFPTRFYSSLFNFHKEPYL